MLSIGLGIGIGKIDGLAGETVSAVVDVASQNLFVGDTGADIANIATLLAPSNYTNADGAPELQINGVSQATSVAFQDGDSVRIFVPGAEGYSDYIRTIDGNVEPRATDVALHDGPGNDLIAYMGFPPEGWAARMRIDGDVATRRLSWRRSDLIEFRNIYPLGDFTFTGSWSQLQTSGSGAVGSYVGNRSAEAGSVGNSADVTVDRSETYDVWVVFTGRTAGGYCRVDIDGSQALVNEIDDPAGLGFRAFPTYTAVDLTRRQYVKVASGLTGQHTITMTRDGTTASPGGTRVLIEAVAITGALGESRILPPVWQPSTAYTIGDEVMFGGTYYSARATGTSGATAPSHTSGIAGDGLLDWQADDVTTYVVDRTYAMDYASERGIAANIGVNSVNQEFGGQTHGGNTLLSQTVTVDGVAFTSPTTGIGLLTGAEIQTVESTRWDHSEQADYATMNLTRTITSAGVNHAVTLTGNNGTGTIDYLYSGMLPFLAQEDGEARFAEYVRDDGSVIDLSDYDGQQPGNVSLGADDRLRVQGAFGGRSVVEMVQVSHTGVGYVSTGSANLTGATEGAGDWTGKLYVSPDLGGTFGAGDALQFTSTHTFDVT